MVYTRQEAAEHLKISLSTLDKLLNSGRLSAFRVGRQIRIPKQALQEFQNASLLTFSGKPEAETISPVLRQ